MPMRSPRSGRSRSSLPRVSTRTPYRGRLDELRDRLRGEVERAEGKLANQGFVANAPPEVVAAEREKLERYRSELDELA